MHEPISPSPHAWKELVREVKQLRQAYSSNRNLARARTRHDAVWMPSSDVPEITYMMLDDLEGWNGSSSGANVRVGNVVGWMGALYTEGPNTEAEVGLAYDAAETTPSTNGLWEATADGLFEITISGVVNYAQLAVIGYPFQGIVRIQLYNLLASGGANAIYATTANQRVLECREVVEFANEWTAAEKAFNYSRTNLVFLHSGDRISLRWQLLDGTNIQVKPFAFVNTMRVRRIGSVDVTAVTL